LLHEIVATTSNTRVAAPASLFFITFTSPGISF
jgi:hypothetical protein